MKKIIISIVLFVVVGGYIYSQDGNSFSQLKPRSPQERQSKSKDKLSIFNEIEAGLIANDIRSFSKHFAKQFYINLHGAEDGFYSANQAFYILQNYFTARRLVNFEFTTMNASSDGMPYATGGGVFIFRGNQETMQIYVSLTKINDRWVISQFNVY